MSNLETVEPVRKQIVIEAPQAHVFRVFTDGMDSWWPRQHHIGSSPMAKQILEPALGGRWYATCVDGTECNVGRVLEWDPPRRIVLAWQLTADWKFDPDFVTEVEINFTAEGARRTRVDLEHRNLARYGLVAPKLRESVDSADGWPLLLARFAAAAEQPTSSPAAVSSGA
jgi:uncharacterized protein YndB with AHSA1/START domain